MRTNLELPARTHKRLRKSAIDHGCTISQLAAEAIEAYLDQKESESNTLWLQNGGLSSDDKSVELAATC